MRLPRVMVGKSLRWLPRRHEPSRCPAHGTHPPRSASAGVHQSEFYLIFSFSFFLPFAQKDFILCFAARFTPLTWSCQATAPHGRLACAAFSSSREPPYQQGTACPAYTGRGVFLSLPTWQTTPPLLWVCCVIHVPPLSSSVNYLFRLLPVSIKRPCSREHGQRWKDLPSGLPYGGECPCSHRYSVESHGICRRDTVPYRTRGNLTRVIVLLLLLRKNRFLMRLAGFGVCDGRSVPRTDPQRQGRSSPTPARRGQIASAKPMTAGGMGFRVP